MANLIVTGTLVPDATGIYVDQGNGTYLRSGGGAYQIAFVGPWYIQIPAFQRFPAVDFWSGGSNPSDPTGHYAPSGGLGIPTVSLASTANTGRVIAEGIIRQ